MLRAVSPRAALLAAKRNTLRAHPGASEMTEYMQRKVSEEKAEDIITSIRSGNWNGWFESHEEE